jgi:RimJ/RimL family protein N-acetyltransferase
VALERVPSCVGQCSGMTPEEGANIRRCPKRRSASVRQSMRTGCPPLDIYARAASWKLDGFFVAVVGDQTIGSISVVASRHGFGEIGMAVARTSRGRGVGSALLQTAVQWAREQGLHKLSLSVFPHNSAAIALYRKFGFVEEGRRVKHYRRTSGELWDSIEMGLLL